MQRTVYHALFFKMRRFYRVVVDGTSPIATVRWDPRGQSGGRWLSYAEFCHLIDAHRVEHGEAVVHVHHGNLAVGVLGHVDGLGFGIRMANHGDVGHRQVGRDIGRGLGRQGGGAGRRQEAAPGQSAHRTPPAGSPAKYAAIAAISASV